MIVHRGCRTAWLILFALSAACSGDDDPILTYDAGTESDSNAGPTPTEKLDGIVSASGTHACAIRHAGLYCWGANFRGQLADQTTEDSTTPVAATGAGDDVVEVATNTGRTCIRRSTGEVGCWGANESGQIGDGTRDDSLTAVRANGIDDAIQIAVGSLSTCTLRGTKGTVECWGESPDTSPESGNLIPQPISGLSDAVELRAGSISAYCARGKPGWVRCFRFDPTTGTWPEPREAEALRNAHAIAMPSEREVCGITAARNIVCQDFEDGFTVTLPSSENSVDISSLGSLSLSSRNSDGTTLMWNVPSIIWSEMGQPDVVGNFAVEITSDIPLIHTVIGGLQFCGLREDRSIVCIDGGMATASLVETRRFEITTVVNGLPD
ncbi:MAG TPA: hypothetical protein VFG30_33625 [Polyangiales bacterium]|nr:hypothetical protein [Polyangiales bacterium]